MTIVGEKVKALDHLPFSFGFIFQNSPGHPGGPKAFWSPGGTMLGDLREEVALRGCLGDG